MTEKGIEWKHMDIRDMVGVADKPVDFAFDKGTLDAMIHGSPWNPTETAKENTSGYLNEVCFTMNTTKSFFLTNPQDSSSTEGRRRLSVCHFQTTTFYETASESRGCMGYGYTGPQRLWLLRLLRIHASQGRDPVDQTPWVNGIVRYWNKRMHGQ